VTERSKNSVVLCECHGRIASRLCLDEIDQFLRGLVPNLRVIVGDDLCQPHALRRLIEEERLRPLVIGACSKVRPRLYFWEEASKVPLDPYSTRIVDLLEETAMPFSDTEVAERVKLLLWAQVKRADEFKGVSQDNLRLGIKPPLGKVSRRELPTMLLPQYEAIPYIEPSKCIGGDKCRLCLDSCPLQAISTGEDGTAISKSICCGCGACVVACPHRAVSYPTFSLEELDSEMEGLLLAEGTLLEPRILALTCQTCLPRHEDDERGQFTYPSNILPLKIPCPAMASPWLMLRAFDRGAQGLALISGKDTCRAGFDAAKWQDTVRFVQAMLDCWNIEAQRIRSFEVGENGQPDTEQELEQFAHEIARVGPTPLKVAEYTSVPTDGLLLPALVGGLGNKLTHSPEGTVSTGAVPFGKVKLDDTQCTGCGLCAINCPTDALTILTSDDSNEYQLLFQHDSCVACGMCVNTCPEGCLRLEHILELDRIGSGASVLFQDSVVKCRRCGKPVAPKSMMDRLKAKLQGTESGFTEWLEICPACRIEVTL